MEEPEIHAHHAHHGGGQLGQAVAIFTAVVATLAAVCSYFGGHTQNQALYYKNDAVLNRAQASDQWAYYQAKSIKQAVMQERLDNAHDATVATELRAKIGKYDAEMNEIRAKAEALDRQAEASNEEAEHALHPHEKLALAITLFQIAISAASITALTRRPWLFALAGASAVGAIAVWVFAFLG